MGDFSSSTHKSRWLFSQQEIGEKFRAANQRAAVALKEYGTTKLEVELDGSVVYPGKKVEVTENEPLAVNEESLMRRFYEQKIQEVCCAFKFPHKIQATAVTYFKRFYLRWSVMEHEPKHIMLTCIYTSCKVEEFHVSAEELGKGIQQDHLVILQNEMLVLQTLGFDLIVYSPYRSIDAFLDIIETSLDANDNDVLQKLKVLKDAVVLEIDKNMLTDVPLLFAPAQIALAALRRMNREHNAFDFDRLLDRVYSIQKDNNKDVDLLSTLNKIDSLVEGLRTLEARDMRHIDRKLKHCRNPGQRDESKKREKKSKHKTKRSASEMQSPAT